MRMRMLAAGAVAAGTLAACGVDAPPPGPSGAAVPPMSPPTVPAPASVDPAPAPAVEPPAPVVPLCDPAASVAALPLDTRLRQLLFVGVFTGGPAPIDQAEAAAGAGVGGINFLGSNSEVYASGELAGVAQAGAIPPFLAVDEEGGRVQRLRPLIGEMPSARTMGATMTVDEVREVGARIGGAMTGLGLTMDFAPVADVSAQPAGAVIGDRAFSADPAAVATYAGAFADGLRSAGIVPVLKHFPGIGSASAHTDFEPATSPDLAQLQRSDLVPYPSLLTGDPLAVMMGTASVPGLTDGEPAALSAPAVDLLRTQLGFDGVVLTDSLSTGAIESEYSLPQAAELALQAGVDMVLWDTTAPTDAVLARLADAVAAGRLTEARVNQSVTRVLDLKNVDPCGLTG